MFDFMYPSIYFPALLSGGAGAGGYDGYGLTPLMHAAAEGDVKRAAALIRQGINLDAVCAPPGFFYEHDYTVGSTALHIAACHGHVQFVEYLIKSGASINAKNHNGETPLDVAVQEHQKAVAKCEKKMKSGWLSAAFQKSAKKLGDARDRYDRVITTLIGAGGRTAIYELPGDRPRQEAAQAIAPPPPKN